MVGVIDEALRLARSRQAHSYPGDCRECDDLDVYIKALESAQSKPEDRILVAELHNGFRVQVIGNDRSIDVLKGLLVSNRDVKWIGVYTAEEDPTQRSRIESLNYTTLKGLREEGNILAEEKKAKRLADGRDAIEDFLEGR